MQKIRLDEAKPSMIIASTVRDKDGNILFLKGVELTERHIAFMHNRGVQRIVVEGCPVQREKSRTDRLSNEIDRRFSTAGPSPAVVKIKDLLKELLA